jgi:hypothetical protein
MKYTDALIVTVFAWIPYILVVWGYTKLTDGDAQTFWIALAVLLGVRLFFYVIETAGSILCWRLYRRHIAVDKALTWLKRNNFPQREYKHDDLSNYLARIEDSPEYSEPLRKAAHELYSALCFIEELGILVGARSWAAWNAALDIYAPSSRAPKQLE